MIRWRRFSFNESPPIFGNSKPKSGSHLLLQILEGMTRILPYAYVAADPVRTIRKTGGRRPEDEILADLQATPRGVIGWGYVEATPKVRAFLCAPGRVNYFLFRDPRDLLVSQVYYATDLREDHGMHALYSALPDFAARLDIAITGIDRDGLKMVSVLQRYDAVLEWLKQPGVLCIRYEDLVDSPAVALEHMLTEIEKAGHQLAVERKAAVRTLQQFIQPQRSATFRAGKTGTWREHFTEKHKSLFREVAGDLLQKLGYEEGSDW